MTVARVAARTFLIIVYSIALAAPWIARKGYADQFRAHAGEHASRQFPLGVDDLGRDRFSRLLYGSRVSLLLAPAAALTAVTIAALVGLLAGAGPLKLASAVRLLNDLLLSLPILFLLLIARAMIPLNVGPWSSVFVTFLLLGALGWPASARVFGSAIRITMGSSFVLQARAQGCSSLRALAAQLLPNIGPLLAAQFLLLIPAFILAEANLGILGLGVSEPLPSWGSMLTELTNPGAVDDAPVRLAPAFLLVFVVLSFSIAGRRRISRTQ